MHQPVESIRHHTKYITRVYTPSTRHSIPGYLRWKDLVVGNTIIEETVTIIAAAYRGIDSCTLHFITGGVHYLNVKSEGTGGQDLRFTATGASCYSYAE